MSILTIEQVDNTLAFCKNDPLATQYWCGYKKALLDDNGKDKVINAVCSDLQRRSEFGLKKYGVTLERKDLTLDQWIEHAYLEALDMANYLKRAMMEMRGEL